MLTVNSSFPKLLNCNRRAAHQSLTKASPHRSKMAQQVSTQTAIPPGATGLPSPTYKLLSYTYVPDILEKRGPYRAEHLAAAQKVADSGKLLMAGAVGDAPEGAVFVFVNTTSEEIQAFAGSDPYVRNNLVTSWSIKPYNVVIKAPEGAINP